MEIKSNISYLKSYFGYFLVTLRTWGIFEVTRELKSSSWESNTIQVLKVDNFSSNCVYKLGKNDQIVYTNDESCIQPQNIRTNTKIKSNGGKNEPN